MIWAAVLCIVNTIIIIIYVPVDSLALSSPASGALSSSPSSSHSALPTITIQFDGSFRPPRDPGCATLPRRLAVAAAAIYCGRVNDDSTTDANQNNNSIHLPSPIAVGTYCCASLVEAAVPHSLLSSSSQHAEYEGLLLGLRYVMEHWQDIVLTTTMMTVNASESTEIDANLLELRIQGDCKTVIDQLSGKALPRKLEGQHREAKRLLEEMQQEQCSSTSIMMTTIKDVTYQLIPRDQNSVCDNLCQNLQSIVVSQKWNDCLHEMEHMDRQNDDGDAQSSSVERILAKYLDPSTSVIRYSLRPPLYQKLATILKDSAVLRGEEDCCRSRWDDHYTSLIRIGERLWEEARLFEPRDSIAAVNNNNSNVQNWKRLGIAYQIEGWRGLGNDKKAAFLQRKHRIVLQTNVESRVACYHYDMLRRLGRVPEEWNERSIPKEWREGILHQWFCKVSGNSQMHSLTPLWLIPNNKTGTCII